MLDEGDVAAFMAAPKSMVGQMEWIGRHGGGSAVAQVPLEHRGLIIGDLIAVQISGAPRSWKFKLRMEGTQVLRWEYMPPGTIRRHRNPRPLPIGFERTDRSLVHEHPYIEGQCGRYSRPLPPDVDAVRHEDAFQAFCAHANISPDGYVEPPTPQLEMLP